MPTYITTFETQIGPLTAAVDEAGALLALYFGREVDSRGAPGEQIVDAARCAHVVTQVQEYFTGERREFDLPMSPRGTEFQRNVWSELKQIPYGQSISYGELAARLGKPAAVRAVGQANGANPIAIIVPCHRVIGANGKLTGYAGGLPQKHHLLAHEAMILMAG